MRRMLTAAVALGLCACASVGERSSSSWARPFEAVRSLALVRWKDDVSPGPASDRIAPKDPLDGLHETLVARGYQARVVDVGPHAPTRNRELERLFSALDARIASSPSRDRSSRNTEKIGADAGAVVSALGVDAIATYHRFPPLPRVLAVDPYGPGPGPLGPTGSGFGARSPAASTRPLGAVALIDRGGNALWYSWGAGTSLAGEMIAPQNAAEAIDALVGALTGEAPEYDDFSGTYP